MDNEIITKIHKKIDDQTKRNNPNFYQPLSSYESQIIRAEYASRLTLSIEGNNITKFYTNCNTHIATGYTRIVIGDYGAYIEFHPDQINHCVIKNKFNGQPGRSVKYIWKESIDDCQVKIYEQKGKVSYADYKIGMYYAHPTDSITDNNEFLYN